MTTRTGIAAKMPACKRGVLMSLALAAAVGTAQQSQANTRNWDGDTSAAWATAGNWDTLPADNLTDDIANFNLPTYGGNPVYAPYVTARKVYGVTIGSGNGAMVLDTNSSGNRLGIGAGGITMAAGAGALTVGASYNTSGVLVGASQTWTNNSSSLLAFRSVSTNVEGNHILTFSGSGSGGFSQNGTGSNRLISDGATGQTLAIVVDYAGSGTVKFLNANTYTGTTTVKRGTLELNGVNAIQKSTLDTDASGTQLVTFTVAGANTYNLGGLQGADDLAIGNNTISVGANGASTTYSGAISGTGGRLTKVGAGTLTLSSAANTYSGGTTVSNGTLRINGNQSGAVSVQNGAALGGSGTVGGAVTLATGGAFKPYDIGGGMASKLTLDGGFAYSAGTLDLSALTNLAKVTHVLAEFPSQAVGTFASVVGLPSGATVGYSPTQITIKNGSAGTVVTIR